MDYPCSRLSGTIWLKSVLMYHIRGRTVDTISILRRKKLAEFLQEMSIYSLFSYSFLHFYIFWQIIGV